MGSPAMKILQSQSTKKIIKQRSKFAVDGNLLVSVRSESTVFSHIIPPLEKWLKSELLHEDRKHNLFIKHLSNCSSSYVKLFLIYVKPFSCSNIPAIILNKDLIII